MAKDINLLPEELRAREKKRFVKSKKDADFSKMKLTNPPELKDIKESEPSLKKGFLSLFKKSKPKFSKSEISSLKKEIKIENNKINNKKNSNNKKSKPPSLKEEISDKKKKHLDVNLMPVGLTKGPELRVTEKLMKLGFFGIFLLIFIGLIYLALTWYQLGVYQKIKIIESEIKNFDQQINLYQKDKGEALKIQRDLKTIESLLANHIHWTNFFDFLEKNTIADVYYLHLAASEDGGIILAARGKDYQSVARQLLAFMKATDFVEEVAINSATAIERAGSFEGVNFDVTLKLKPEIFLLSD